LRRADIGLKFSNGFHPKPKISFEDPLPTGMESEQEKLFLHVSADISAGELVHRLNLELPKGIRALSCREFDPARDAKAAPVRRYRVRLHGGHRFSTARLRRFEQRESVTLTRQNRKGALRTFDLKQLVTIRLIDQRNARLAVRSQGGKTLRPGEVLGRVFQLEEGALRRLRVVKQAIG
jgi:radical SAM-linked protein